MQLRSHQTEQSQIWLWVLWLATDPMKPLVYVTIIGNSNLTFASELDCLLSVSSCLLLPNPLLTPTPPQALVLPQLQGTTAITAGSTGGTMNTMTMGPTGGTTTIPSGIIIQPQYFHSDPNWLILDKGKGNWEE